MKKFLIVGLIFAPIYVIIVLLIYPIDKTGEYLLAYFVLGIGIFLAIYFNMDKFIKLKKENEELYICELCKKEFEKAITDEEANKESEELFGVKEASNRDDMAIICDDCFKKIMKKETYILEDLVKKINKLLKKCSDKYLISIKKIKINKKDMKFVNKKEIKIEK